MKEETRGRKASELSEAINTQMDAQSDQERLISWDVLKQEMRRDSNRALVRHIELQRNIAIIDREQARIHKGLKERSFKLQGLYQRIAS